MGSAACAAAVRPPLVDGPEQLRLFDLGVDVSVLRMERAAIRAGGRSAATVKAYASDWRGFSAWCVSAGRSALPASADTVSLYAVSLARAGRLPSTICRRMAAVASAHLASGLASPVTGDVRELLSGIGRKLGTAPRMAKAALAVSDLRLMLAALDGCGRRGVYSWEMPGGAARVARDRALLLVGFASGLRRSELAGLDLADVAFEDGGLVLRLVRSKTDQAGEGREVGVHRGRRAVTCPVRALEGWLVERGRAPGPLFCRVASSGAVSMRRLSGEAVAAVVHASARRAGLDPSRYAGHSLRAGMATAAAAAGASELAIMARTGHRSLAMLGRYVRHGSVLAVDPLAGVL